jgi:hypothetical protein
MASLAINVIAEYHNDVDRSLRLFFSELSPSFSVQFFGLTSDEIRKKLEERLEETDQRSAFFILTSMEAAFKVDYEFRCRRRLRDALSRKFREMYRNRKTRVHLEDDIFEAWKEFQPEARHLIAEMKGAFKFRHWMAHGRYGAQRFGRTKYDFAFLFSLADDILALLPLQSE